MFIPPSLKKQTPFVGVVFQKQNLGAGYFPGGDLDGLVSLTPNSAYIVPPVSEPQGVKPLPAVAFQQPKDAARIEALGVIAVSGFAKAKAGVKEVTYQVLYNGTLAAPQPATGTSDWNINFMPTANAGGTYKFFVKAEDKANHESDVAARTFFYVVPTPLTVTVSGPGTVTSGFDGTTTRDIGASYTLTARPQRGHTFTGWTGSISSTAPTITFTMTVGFSVQANFQ